MGLISGNKSVSFNLPDGIGGIEINADNENNIGIKGTLIKETHYFRKNSVKDFEKGLTVPLGLVNVNLKANPKEIQRRISSPQYQKTMQLIKQSYNGGGSKLSWEKHNK